MPDSRPLLRRLLDARLLTRLVTHVSVVALVAFSAAAGLTATVGRTSTPAADTRAAAFDLIGAARAAETQAALKSASFILQPNPENTDLMLSRRSLPAPTPVPTPAASAVPLAPSWASERVPSAFAVGSGAMLWPVPGGVITQYFSPVHLALDIAAPAGSTVIAADNGIVTSAGWRNNGGGLVIAIDHGNGIQTVYNHLGSAWVSVGQRVARGQAIAGVGCTGMCTGPHVHFEVIVGGIIVNPLRFL